MFAGPASPSRHGRGLDCRPSLPRSVAMSMPMSPPPAELHHARAASRSRRWLPVVLAALCLPWLAIPAPLAMHAVQGLTLLGPDLVWCWLTWLGDTHVALTLLVAAALLGGHMRALPLTLHSLLPATLATHALKALAARPRPAAVLPPEALHVVGEVLRHGSFPSGHTVTAFTLAGCWVLAAAPQRRARAALVALPLAAGVGVSRIAVGAHWPLDVAFGALLGWLCALLASAAARRWPLPSVAQRRPWAALAALALGLTLGARALPAEVQPLAFVLGGLAVGSGVVALLQELPRRRLASPT